jgi:hypothetical protein
MKHLLAEPIQHLRGREPAGRDYRRQPDLHDPDAGDTHSYTLVSGAGSTDNSLFRISGSLLQTNAVFDFEARKTYSVRLRVTDAGGLFSKGPSLSRSTTLTTLPRRWSWGE